jgi:hypothetical protein
LEVCDTLIGMGQAPIGVVLVMLGLALLFMLAGVVLLVRAVRGKRINERRVCRRCRFDLSGQGDLKATLGADGSVHAVRCPECGNDVWKPGNVRIGQRKRAPLWGLAGVGGLAGVLLLALSVGSVGVLIARNVSAKTVYAALPNWVLIELANGRLGNANADVMDEVVSRLPKLVSGPGVVGGSGTSAAVVAPRSWKQEHMKVLAERAADGIQQASSAVLVDSWLGVYREAMKTPGLTTDELTARVAGSAVVVSLRARSVIRQGEMPYVDFQAAYKTGFGSGSTVAWASRAVRVRFKNKEGGWGEAFDLKFPSQVRTQTTISSGRQGFFVADLHTEPGEYEVKYEGEWVATLTSVPQLPIGGGHTQQENILSTLPTRTVVWTSTLRVLPENQPAVVLDSSEASVQRLASGVQVAMLRWQTVTVLSGSKPPALQASHDERKSYQWLLGISIDSLGQLRPNELRVLAQCKDSDGKPIGEPWQLQTAGWHLEGTSSLSLMMPMWYESAQRSASGCGPEAPTVDIVIEPSLGTLESSMQTHAVAARLTFTGLRVLDQSSPVTDNVSIMKQVREEGKMSGGAVASVISSEELLLALDQDRAAQQEHLRRHGIKPTKP